MEFLLQLWLPILITGVVLFFASFVAWTVLPHHESDFSPLPNEDKLMEAIKLQNVAPGAYMFPYMTHAQAKDPEKISKYTSGPRGNVFVWDMPNMGKNLLRTLVYFLLIAAITAYISWEALQGQTVTFLKAFQIVGAIGVLTFASSGQLNAIWFPRRTLMDFVDGIVYGVLMGLVFGLCWPSGV
ncbi:MAG: hypothetical protein JNL67_08805 [Planctomycetaceae bacterium]|nr:hypothetical protein [Planctomycetaceae bacterium]